MAIDSALKRSSATDVLSTFRGWVFPGVAGVSKAERQAATWFYSGIAAAAPGVDVGSTAISINYNGFGIMKLSAGRQQP